MADKAKRYRILRLTAEGNYVEAGYEDHKREAEKVAKAVAKSGCASRIYDRTDRKIVGEYAPRSNGRRNNGGETESLRGTSRR